METIELKVSPPTSEIIIESGHDAPPIIIRRYDRPIESEDNVVYQLKGEVTYTLSMKGEDTVWTFPESLHQHLLELLDIK